LKKVLFEKSILKGYFFKSIYIYMKFSLTSHPNKNGMTYFKHLFFSLKFSFILFIASIKALIHALCPFLFETSTGEAVKQINICMQQQHGKRQGQHQQGQHQQGQHQQGQHQQGQHQQGQHQQGQHQQGQQRWNHQPGFRI
jgi:hypothetical protein